MAAAVCVDSSSRELANLSETLKNLRAAGADARFIIAVELTEAGAALDAACGGAHGKWQQ